VGVSVGLDVSVWVGVIFTENSMVFSRTRPRHQRTFGLLTRMVVDELVRYFYLIFENDFLPIKIKI
jgi:hypothetical protein